MKTLVVSNSGFDPEKSCHDIIPGGGDKGADIARRLTQAMNRVQYSGSDGDKELAEAIDEMDEFGWRLISVVSSKFMTCIFRKIS